MTRRRGRQPFLLGLTGGLASGKSTVAKMLAELGCRVVDADDLVAELYRPGRPGARAVRELFGEAALTDEGAVDHAEVARRVFADAGARKRLEAAVHPLVRRRFAETAEEAAEDLVVLEATLLVEAGYAEDFDLVVSVEAPEELRSRRAVERGLDPEAARARLEAQGDGEIRRAGAHRILVNDGTLEELRGEVERLVASIRGTPRVGSPSRTSRTSLLALLLPAVAGLLLSTCRAQPPAPSFALEETTVAEIHRALTAGEITCAELVDRYLARITVFDQPGGLNAVTVTNPRAPARAAELDAELERTGTLRPLHCLPLIVKDNYDTTDLETAAGSLALAGSTPPDDAHQVRALREAGAVVIAKSNMAEWAFSPYQTVSSLAGTTVNPYDPERVPAGSSGGTAAAVAANLAAAGLGTDTGNSIRGPASHTALVGLRSTLGLTSRDGIVPLYLNRDVGGPMTRTVEDAARMLEVIAGPDPADPLTAASADKVPDEGYVALLSPDALTGARIGVLRTVSDTETADPEIRALFEQALRDLAELGSEVVDGLALPGLIERQEELWCNTFRHDLDAYLTTRQGTPFSTLEEIVASGRYAPYIEERLQRSLETPPPAEQEPPCLGVEEDPRRAALLSEVVELMAAHHLDALAYPSWSNPPRKLGDLESPHGNNSPLIAPHTGQPAITVPMGFTEAGLPAGLQLLGLPWGDADLLRFAYAYEQATQHRRPPEGFGPLP